MTTATKERAALRAKTKRMAPNSQVVLMEMTIRTPRVATNQRVQIDSIISNIMKID